MSRIDKRIEKHVKVQWAAWWPLIAYFVLTLAIAIAVFFLDRKHFGTDSRWPRVPDIDGVTSSFAPYIFLQSDVTSLISFSLSVLRFVGVMSVGTITWRCIYFLMGKEQGIPLKDIQWIIGFGLPKRSRGTHRNALALVSAILLMAFPSQFSSPILTGSITWSPSTYLVHGNSAVHRIPFATNGTAWTMHRGYTSIVDVVAQQAAGLAGAAWGNNNPTSKSMVRVLPSIQNLPNGTELASITVPYFAIDKVEWLEDPEATITPSQRELVIADNDFTQRTADGPLFAFVPDDTWGPTMDNYTFPPPRIMAETRLVKIIVDSLTNISCSHTSGYCGEIPSNIGLYQVGYSDGNVCYAFARVTYRAGAAVCDRCRSNNRFVFTNTTILEVQEDVMTTEALSVMFLVSQLMVFGNFSLPSPIDNINNFITEGLSRSYQATWNALHRKLGTSSTALSTEVKVSVPASQADVAKWRIFAWMLINTMFTLSGFICFVAIQDPVIVDVPISSMLLETDHTIRDHPQVLGDMSVMTEGDRNLRLHLQHADGHRTLTIIDPPSEPGGPGRGYYKQLH